MARVLPVVLALGLVVYALIDCLQSPAAGVRVVPKAVWVGLILGVPVLGAVAWLLAGRPRLGPTGVAGPPPRPLAPDDDPEFLRQLRSIDEEHERMLRQWERELRRREERLRDEDRPEDRP